MFIDIDTQLKQSKEKWANRRLKRKNHKDYLECGKASTTCKCPKCGIEHETYIQWTGRGVPRIFCGNCKPLVACINDLAGHCGIAAMGKSARKSPAHCTE